MSGYRKPFTMRCSRMGESNQDITRFLYISGTAKREMKIKKKKMDGLTTDGW
jgi:hypothetical protein